jgi:hypothetical protein
VVVNRRAVTGLLVTALVLAATVGPVAPQSASPVVTRLALRPTPFQPAPRPTLQLAASQHEAGCDDDSGAWMGTRWTDTVRWRFNPATVPAYLPVADARAAVARAAGNVADAANACGLPGDLGTAQRYAGPTSRYGLFFLTEPTACGARWDLEGALSHEFGHVFGLGHVSADGHPGLTMADTLPPCDTVHRGLGLGDYTMLRAHY